MVMRTEEITNMMDQWSLQVAQVVLNVLVCSSPSP